MYAYVCVCARKCQGRGIAAPFPVCCLALAVAFAMALGTALRMPCWGMVWAGMATREVLGIVRHGGVKAMCGIARTAFAQKHTGRTKCVLCD